MKFRFREPTTRDTHPACATRRPFIHFLLVFRALKRSFQKTQNVYFTNSADFLLNFLDSVKCRSKKNVFPIKNVCYVYMFMPIFCQFCQKRRKNNLYEHCSLCSIFSHSVICSLKENFSFCPNVCFVQWSLLILLILRSSKKKEKSNQKVDVGKNNCCLLSTHFHLLKINENQNE